MSALETGSGIAGVVGAAITLGKLWLGFVQSRKPEVQWLREQLELKSSKLDTLSIEHEALKDAKDNGDRQIQSLRAALHECEMKRERAVAASNTGRFRGQGPRRGNDHGE